MNKEIFYYLLIVFLVVYNLGLISAAHFIVGIVNNAGDGTSSNGRTVVLYNPSIGINDNITDIVGPSGSSGADNIYLFDCELLNETCDIGDELRIEVLPSVYGYISDYSLINVTGAGFDVAPNITINSPPRILNITIEDNFYSPIGQIDLNPFSSRNVTCNGTIIDYDGDGTVINISSEIFDNSASFYGDGNDNNDHYTNDSCYLNNAYGNQNEVYFECGFSMQYFSNPGNWNCTINIYDSFNISVNNSNTTLVNTLLAISVNNTLDFGNINVSDSVSNETPLSITNAGNSMLNLSLSGYGLNVNDNLSMRCGFGQNISIEYLKYNLTSSKSGLMNLTDFEMNYTNLTTEPNVKRFDLHYRKADSSPYIDDTNLTFWRIYVPLGVQTSCNGNIVIGATSAPGGG